MALLGMELVFAPCLTLTVQPTDTDIHASLGETYPQGMGSGTFLKHPRRSVDQSPFHQNEAGSHEHNTITLQDEGAVPLIENHAFTRRRWRLNSITDSDALRVERQPPGCELMFKTSGTEHGTFHKTAKELHKQ